MLLVLIPILLVSLFIGSNIFFYNTAISVSNIALLLCNICLLWFIKKKINISVLFLTGLYFLFILFQLIYLITKPLDYEYIKDFIYSTYVLTLILIIWFAYKEQTIKLLKLILNTSFIIWIVLLIILLTEILFDIHLSNSMVSVNRNLNVPTGLFDNPNDLATVVCIFFPFLFYGYEIINNPYKQKIITIVTAIIILATLSRLVFVFFCLFPFFNMLVRRKYFNFIIIVLLCLVTVITISQINITYLTNKDNNLISQNINRILTIFDAESYNLQQGESSISQRIRIAQNIIINAPDFIIGKGFKGSDKHLSTFDGITITNPHSYFIESIINFGILGFMPVICMFILLLIITFYHFEKNILFRYLLIQLIYFMVLINIPSSIFRFTLLWFPIIFMMVIAFSHHNTNKSIVKTEILV